VGDRSNIDYIEEKQQQQQPTNVPHADATISSSLLLPAVAVQTKHSRINKFNL
tara:strand:- start:112 stop:270 length:159 start_codon:yes stop_codon:yes gene_type:complete